MTKHEFNPTILREYDIRGIIDETLFEADAEAIGRTFGTLLKQGGFHNVAVGYDGRTTSPKLKAALTKGLTSTGVDVFDIGMGPTPMLYYATYALEAGGGIMITGSHNPPSHNGFKMMLGSKSFYGSQIQELGRLSANGPFAEGTGKVIDHPIMEDYVARVLQDFVAGRELSVVWDCGNGVTGEALRRIVAKLPGTHLLLFDEIDGSFMLSTDLADYLVTKGIAFREAHNILGKIVKFATEENKKLNQISIEEYKKFNEVFENELKFTGS